MKKIKIIEAFAKGIRDFYSEEYKDIPPDDFNFNVMRRIHALDYNRVKEAVVLEREEIFLWRFSLASICFGLLFFGLLYFSIGGNDSDNELSDGLNAGYSIENIYSFSDEETL